MTTQRKKRQTKRNFVPAAVEPRNERQAELLTLLESHPSVIALGPAGTGKTFISTCFAASQLIAKRTSHLIIARPIVGVGNTLGLLPGSLNRKLEPWSRPMVEALKRHMGERHWEDAQQNGSIEVTSLEHVRGLTYDDAIMIIDEAQNTTPREMKAFLTRIGQSSRVIILGDHSQSDLNGPNGLDWCMQSVRNGWAPSTGTVEFLHEDIVRSELCKEWAFAFDQMAKAVK